MQTLHKIFLTSLALLLVVLHAHCQGQVETERDIDDNRFMITGGINLHQNFMGEIGVAYGSAVEFERWPLGFQAIRLTTEFNTSKNNFIIGPKLSFEYDYVLGGFRVGIIDYKESNKNDFRFVPEIGITFVGLIDIFYGVNIPLTGERISAISLNRISLIIHLDFLRFNKFFL